MANRDSVHDKQRARRRWPFRRGRLARARLGSPDSDPTAAATWTTGVNLRRRLPLHSWRQLRYRPTCHPPPPPPTQTSTVGLSTVGLSAAARVKNRAGHEVQVTCAALPDMAVVQSVCRGTTPLARCCGISHKTEHALDRAIVPHAQDFHSKIFTLLGQAGYTRITLA